MPPGLGERIRDLRNDRKWSQEFLAEQMRAYGHLTITYQRIGEMERGERKVDVEEAAALARIFGMRLNELLCEPDL